MSRGYIEMLMDWGRRLEEERQKRLKKTTMPHDSADYYSLTPLERQLAAYPGAFKWQQRQGREFKENQMCNEQTAAAELAAVLKTDRVREAEKRLTEAVGKFREFRSNKPVTYSEFLRELALASEVAEAHLALEDAIEAEAEKVAESIAKAQRALEDPIAVFNACKELGDTASEAWYGADSDEQDEIANEILAGRDKAAEEKA